MVLASGPRSADDCRHVALRCRRFPAHERLRAHRAAGHAGDQGPCRGHRPADGALPRPKRLEPRGSPPDSSAGSFLIGSTGAPCARPSAGARSPLPRVCARRTPRPGVRGASAGAGRRKRQVGRTPARVLHGLRRCPSERPPRANRHPTHKKHTRRAPVPRTSREAARDRFAAFEDDSAHRVPPPRRSSRRAPSCPTWSGGTS